MTLRQDPSDRRDSDRVTDTRRSAKSKGNSKGAAKLAVRPSQFRLGFLVHDVSRLRRTVVDKGLKPLGVTRSQWWVLANLSRTGDGMMQTELARILDLGKVALGSLLHRLEANGYVVRPADPDDHRARRVQMTETGKVLLAAIQERAVVLNREMVVGFTAEEVRLAEEMLHRLKARLQEMDTRMRQADGEDIDPIDLLGP
jgi:DNA-binding MarR family transcriptional regulator